MRGGQKVQTLLPQRAYEPFAEGVGLRTLGRCFQQPQSPMAHLLIELRRENAIPILQGRG